MELQWPLILFTTLVAWSAGVFGTQAVLALRGEAPKAQLSCWITAAVLLAAGGIAVFFHLEHFERIFNGFGHLTSGITQELIAIVVPWRPSCTWCTCAATRGRCRRGWLCSPSRWRPCSWW